ncbi:unnamed protein product [Somion occarium]|uniref:DNA damage-binding protein 1 n=1 Tax=Somion occarium TaxID=3059160 RepID=A0ABP1E1X2_9APHY
MKIVTTFHPTSSVVASVKCCLTSDNDLEHLVVAKPNSVEVFTLTLDGLRKECELEIWGRVLALRTIPIQTGSKLLVLTDHPDPHAIVLEYHTNAAAPYLSTESSLSLHDRNAMHAEFCTDVIVLSLEQGKIVESFDVAIPELNLLAISFLDHHEYQLVVAHIDAQRRIQLLSRELEFSAREISAEPSEFLPSTTLLQSAFPFPDSPLHLISVPAFEYKIDDHDVKADGGVLVIGGRQIQFFELAHRQQQRAKKDKRSRLDKRKTGDNEEQKMKAKEKEKERNTRKVKPRASVKWPWSEVAAVCNVDFNYRRILIGDKFGRLSLLTIDDKLSLIITPIGEISPPMTLTYLSSQIVYIGSHYGDSQLVRILPAPASSVDVDTLPIPSDIITSSPASLTQSEKGKEVMTHDGKDRAKGIVLKLKGSHVEVLETYRNIAPIVDAILADLDDSGQPQIVTCSGENSTGSLNVIQTGADFLELANLKGLSEVIKIHPIRSRFESSIHTHLLFTTYHESYIFRLDDRSSLHRLEESSTGFITSAPTLALSNITRRTLVNGKSSYVDSSWVVQVTAKSIALLEFDDALGVFHKVGSGWSPDRLEYPLKGNDIVSADISPSQIVVGLAGGYLLVLTTNDEGQIQVLRTHSFRDEQRQAKEICAISCQPLDATKFFTVHIAVSFFTGNTVAVLSLEKPELQVLCESTALPSLPYSLMLHNFGSGRKAKDPDFRPVVLVGLTHGSIVTFNFKDNGLHDKKVLPLGNIPVSLSACEVDGRRAVFASGSRSTVLYWDRQRIRHSSVLLKDLAAAARLNSSAFSSALILATESSIVIGRVRGVDKMQIRQIPLGYDNPRRITYHSGLGEFGVASRQITPSRVGDAESYRSTFNLLHGQSFQRLCQFVCEPEEEITSVCALEHLDSSNPVFEARKPTFCIGTVYHRHGEREPSAGRLIVFQESTPDDSSAVGSKLSTLAEIETSGCVWAIDVVKDMIVAAMNSSVVLYTLATNPVIKPPVISLHKLHEWNHNYTVISLVAHDDIITIGDAISSVSVLQVSGKEIKSVARDYGPLWPVAVEALPDKGVIGGNADGNLFSFALERTDQRTILSQNGSYHLGEMVTKIVPGSIAAQETQDVDVFKPEHLFFTSSGRICQTLHVNDERISLGLTALQHNMSKKLVGAGDIRHSKWRTPANRYGRSDADAAIGFLDGDFLEQFLNQADAEALLQGENEAERVPISPAKMRDLLEKLQSLH